MDWRYGEYPIVPDRVRHRGGFARFVLSGLAQKRGEMADNAKISKTFFILNGEPAGTRTPGPKIKSLMLYQLSYGLTPPG